MKVLNESQMVEALKKRFPNSEILDGVLFSGEYKDIKSIWFRNASSVTYTTKDLNPISALDNCLYFSKVHNIDVYYKFENWCKKRGWYPSTEDYTMMIFPLK